MIKEEYQILYNLEGKYWWFLGQARTAFDMLRRHLKNKQNILILDAGCGTGKNLEYLQRYGPAQGLDFSEEALKFCRQRGLKSLKRGEIENLPYPDDTFELVTCFGVLYHRGIKDDFQAIKELQRVCRPGGYVLINTPAGEFLTSPLFASQHDRQQHTARRHSKAGLRCLMKKAGLEVVEISYMNMFLMPGVVLVRLLKNLSQNILPSRRESFQSELQMPSPAVNRFLLSVLLFENRLIKRFSLPFGLTVVGLGRKK